MTTMRAIIVQDDRSIRIEERPIPKPHPNEVLLHIICAGANPSDWMALDIHDHRGQFFGTDFVGRVVELGSEVPNDQVHLGEVRWNYGHWTPPKGRYSCGAFADYITTDWDLSSVVPPGISPYQASTFPLPFMTAVQMLYLPACLNLPQYPEKASPGSWILIWSGATAVGSFAIQLAKLSGFKVATTASPKRWDIVKSFGADVVVDYRDPDVVEKLKEKTGHSISYGVDCVTKGDSTRLCQLAFRPEGGHLITALQSDAASNVRPEVKTGFTFVFTMLGEDQNLSGSFYKSDASHRNLQARWAKLATQLLAEGKLKPLPVTVFGDLDSVPEGTNILREGKHDGKLAYSINPLA